MYRWKKKLILHALLNRSTYIIILCSSCWDAACFVLESELLSCGADETSAAFWSNPIIFSSSIWLAAIAVIAEFSAWSNKIKYTLLICDLVNPHFHTVYNMKSKTWQIHIFYLKCKLFWVGTSAYNVYATSKKMWFWSIVLSWGGA